MKEIKFLLWNTFVSAYTSAWWALMRWGKLPKINPQEILPGSWILLLFLSMIGLFLLISAIHYMRDNWDQK